MVRRLCWTKIADRKFWDDTFYEGLTKRQLDSVQAAPRRLISAVGLATLTSWSEHLNNCSGSILSTRKVLTAADCLQYKNPCEAANDSLARYKVKPEEISIITVAGKGTEKEGEYSVESIDVYPDYGTRRKKIDAAILTVIHN